MMGFGFNISDLTPFLNKLNKNELTLENILDEEEIIEDIRNNNDCQFIKFFTNENIKKLIDYSTKLPTSNSLKIGYKYPFNATEILCSGNTELQNKLMAETPFIEKDNNTEVNLNEQLKQAKKIRKDGFISALFKIINKVKKKKDIIHIEENESDDEEYESSEEEESEEEEKEILDKDDNKENKKPKVIYENIDYLLQFLKESDETKENYVLVGYFYKILNNLINIHSTKIVQYLFDYPKKDELDILGLFIKHMNRKSMCNIIYKLLIFEGEINSKFDDKKFYLIERIFDELNITNENIKIECICDSLSSVMNNTQFFNLFMTRADLLEKLYNILFTSEKNTKKLNSLYKLLIKINENILQRFEVHYTSVIQESNNNEVNQFNAETCYSNDQDKSITSRGDNSEILKNYLFFLFNILEKNKFNNFEDFAKFNQEENDEFNSTYIEKQKKIGMKRIIQTEYLQSIIEIIINSYASKYHESKIETLIDLAKEKNVFWNLHIIFFLFPFSNIYQIYYKRIIELVINEHSPNCLTDAFFMKASEEKKSLIELYIEKILSDMEFNFNLTKTKSLNPCFSFAVSILNKIYNCQNMNVKRIIEENNDLSAFNETIGEEINNIFSQKLLLNNTFEFGESEEEKPLKFFGPKSFLELFEENCKIYEAYKNGENYQKLLSDKKKRIEKENSAKKPEKDNIEKNFGLEYIDDIDDEDDDPLFKVEKVSSKKEKENFLDILNKPTDEIIQDKDMNNMNGIKGNENDIYDSLYKQKFNNIDLYDNEDNKIENNNLNMENINIETEKINDDSLPNQKDKIYHVEYNENINKVGKIE